MQFVHRDLPYGDPGDIVLAFHGLIATCMKSVVRFMCDVGHLLTNKKHTASYVNIMNEVETQNHVTSNHGSSNGVFQVRYSV